MALVSVAERRIPARGREGWLMNIMAAVYQWEGIAIRKRTKKP